MKKLYTHKLCPHCGRYSTRGVSADAVIVKNDQILLIQRALDPFKGFWATPGGYVGWNETIEDAIRREVTEETGLRASGIRPVGVYSQPARHPDQVINCVYIVDVEDVSALKPGDDATEAKWFPLTKLPVNMAFDHRQNIKDAISLLGVR